MNVTIPYIVGDGIGPDIMKAALKVIDVACKDRISWINVHAGQEAQKKHGELLPQETLDAIGKCKVCLKGPLMTPVGEGFRSINVTLRQKLDLYACIRPVKYIPGVSSPFLNAPYLDVVIFRENTEDVYAGIEYESLSEGAEKLIDFMRARGFEVRGDSGIGIKPISRFGTRRIVRAALNYTLKAGRKSATIVHKGNIMKYTEGAFMKWAYEIADKEFADLFSREGEGSGKPTIKDRIADNMFQQLVLRTSEYDVLVTPNLNGDYLSDLAAALAGGLGVAPGANMNYETGIGVFEATHGSAPSYADRNMANPTSLILSGVMMLEFLGLIREAGSIRMGIEKTILQKKVTYDIARGLGVPPLGTSEFADAVVENMGD